MALKDQADTLLSSAVANGDVPGVVALVTDTGGNIYEAGFAKRRCSAC